MKNVSGVMTIWQHYAGNEHASKQFTKARLTHKTMYRATKRMPTKECVS